MQKINLINIQVFCISQSVYFEGNFGIGCKMYADLKKNTFFCSAGAKAELQTTKKSFRKKKKFPGEKSKQPSTVCD